MKLVKRLGTRGRRGGIKKILNVNGIKIKRKINMSPGGGGGGGGGEK